MQSKIRKALLAIAGGALAALGMSMVGGGTTVAGAETVRAGNIVMTVDGQVRPQRLPQSGFAPAALNVRGQLQDTDGEHPQRMQSMVLDFDNDGRLFSRGLPTCQPQQIENTTPERAREICGPAQIGSGFANAQVKFPDQDAFQAPAEDMLLFNMPGDNMVVHAYAFTPLPTTFVVPVRIRRSPNQQVFRHRAIVRMPLIAGGNGSLTHFNATIRRSWRFRGNARSYIYARCSRGVHRAQGQFRFLGGPIINASIQRRCAPRRG